LWRKVFKVSYNLGSTNERKKMISISNFCNSDPVEIHTHNDKCGKLVSIIQYGKAMRFQHSMTPAQAREMADALIKSANKLENEE